MSATLTPAEKLARVDGLTIRYLEAGRGPDVLLLHGASLGSSADVWDLSLVPLAHHGFRVIAFDQPGFGLSDDPLDHSVAYRRRFILAFMDALKIGRADLIGHSQAGRLVVSLALEHPARIAHIVVLGTGSLLPPLGDGDPRAGLRDGEEGTAAEPTVEDTRALLEANLFDLALITPEVVDRRHRMSVGKNFLAFQARSRTGRTGEKEGVPLWQRLDQVPVPMLMLYGREDRGAAAERARLARTRFPALNLHILDRCKHLIPMDAAAEFVELTSDFLKRDARPAAGRAAGKGGQP
jgi:4,5:9,10-diseco-3-hydroxy-5,9,17-trioxoandrosta-1(10),2-diene-4-oate hydrolase